MTQTRTGITGFTDMHSHFVYGLDDGAKDKSVMCAMLDAAYRDGIRRLYSTPHVTPGVDPFDRGLYLRRLDEARAYCLEKGYAMELFTGAELLYTPALEQFSRNHPLFTLADGDHVLIEFSPGIAFREIVHIVDYLERNDYIPVIAHIERYDCFFQGGNFRSFRDGSNALCQVNAETVINGAGFWRNQYLKRFFRDGLIDIVSSDAHNCTTRPYRMREAYKALIAREGRAYARELVSWDGGVK